MQILLYLNSFAALAELKEMLKEVMVLLYFGLVSLHIDHYILSVFSTLFNRSSKKYLEPNRQNDEETIKSLKNYLFIFLYSRFLLVIHFIHISVYMSIPISQFITPPPPLRHFPPLVSIRLFSTCVSLFLPCKLVHLYHFSRFHIYALIYDICFSLSNLLHSV